MLNIISRSIVEGGINGPQKVVANLIKGLDLLGYPYCLNKELSATSQLWIHDDPIALREAGKRKLSAIVGPNIYILPRNIPASINLSKFVYVFPSKWSADFWKDFGFDRCRQDYWPTGVDAAEFPERPQPDDGIVLLYFKQRYSEELEFTKSILTAAGLKFETIIYGAYDQKNYLELLQKTKYIIWLGRQESQGIALEEALAMNVPILVWDVQNIGHWIPTRKESKIFNAAEAAYPQATAAYYFDERCGFKTKEKSAIENLVKTMEAQWRNFEPREYVLEKLSLAGQARAMIDFFEKYFGVTFESGKNESIKTGRKWRNDRWYFKASMYLKARIKKVINQLKKIIN